MDSIFEITQALVDIPSLSNGEAEIGNYLFDFLSKIAERSGGRVERMDAEGDRFNVFACWDEPLATLSTHMDTVPPFFPSREDEEYIWGRGACDAKGIIACMIVAAEKLLNEGVRNFGLLFVVGEERNSAGAIAASLAPRGSRYLVNGEPTENKLALGSKGALRFEVTARGRSVHSAYPEMGESAIEALLDVLAAIRQISLPMDALLGCCTMNIGTIRGGEAPNVIADFAQAEILVRLVGDAEPIRAAFSSAIGTRSNLKEVLCIPAMRFEPLDGLPTTVVSYSTDVPILSRSWGKPLLIGPGDIHVAHTLEERVSKKELFDAVEIYAGIVRRLLGRLSESTARVADHQMRAS
jgi:acetylornithine deacetylase